MNLPDFLIIGSMKCGTSTLQAQLATTPGVFMTEPKEPNFFSDDAIFAKGLGWYQALFASAVEGDLRGEASTHYTKLPSYPETVNRMSTVLTAPKLVYMIRNPVERAVSHYIHEWSEGQMSADMAAAFEVEPTLYEYGRYAMQLQPFIDSFGLSNIHLTSLEALKADPQAELDTLSAFLGLKNPISWNPDLSAQNVSAQRTRKFFLQKLLLANPVARGLRRALIPKAIRTRVRAARTIGARPALPEVLKARLEDIYTQDRKQLAKAFPGHRALVDCYPFATS